MISQVVFMLLDILSSPFIVTTISAFFGSVGGASIILFIQNQKEKNKKLILINSCLAKISSNIETLILFKVQLASPQFEEVKNLRRKIEAHEQSCKKGGAVGKLQLNLDACVKHVFLPSLEVDFHEDILSSYSHNNSKIIIYLNKCRNSQIEFLKIAEEKNQYIKEIESDPLPMFEKAIKCLGYKISLNDGKNPTILSSSSNNKLHDLSKILVDVIDIALFFHIRSIDIIGEYSGEILTARQRKKMAKIKIDTMEYKEYLPSNDFVSGY